MFQIVGSEFGRTHLYCLLKVLCTTGSVFFRYTMMLATEGRQAGTALYAPTPRSLSLFIYTYIEGTESERERGSDAGSRDFTCRKYRMKPRFEIKISLFRPL